MDAAERIAILESALLRAQLTFVDLERIFKAYDKPTLVKLCKVAGEGCLTALKDKI